MKALAVVSLLLGIVGILFCWFGIGIIPAALALVFGFTACFSRTARRIAVTGLMLGLIGAIVSAGVVYALVELGKHPETVWQTGQEQLEDFMEKRIFLQQYPEEVVKSASGNANVPNMLILINPRSYMELVINELKKNPEKYPAKTGEEKEHADYSGES
jgi:hypothetical protein